MRAAENLCEKVRSSWAKSLGKLSVQGGKKRGQDSLDWCKDTDSKNKEKALKIRKKPLITVVGRQREEKKGRINDKKKRIERNFRELSSKKYSGQALLISGRRKFGHLASRRGEAGRRDGDEDSGGGQLKLKIWKLP